MILCCLHSFFHSSGNVFCPGNYFHFFLIPGEGFYKIAELSDKLYSGILKSNLRLDLDYITHIGIGNSMNEYVCKKMVDDWSERNIEISGTINSIDVVGFDYNFVSPIEKIRF